MKEKIKSNWRYPCVKNRTTQTCEYKNAQVIIEFGILKNGVVQFAELGQASSAGLEIYDHYALEAIKRSSPFPVMPPAVVPALTQGRTGMPIVLTFDYILDLSVSSLLAQSGGRVGVVTMGVGVVTMINGSVVVDRPHESRPIILRAGTAVFLSDRITTGDGARIEMVLGGKIDVAMQERSMVTITELPGRSTLIIGTGRLAINVPGDRMQPGEVLDVRTPNAVASVSGGVRMSVETLPTTQAGGAVVTHVEVLGGSTWVAIYAGTPRPGDISAGIAAAPAIHLRANDGLTITGDVAGPIRARRTMIPPMKSVVMAHHRRAALTVALEFVQLSPQTAALRARTPG